MVDAKFRQAVENYFRAFNARDEPAYLACFAPGGAVGGSLTGPATPGEAIQKTVLRVAQGGMGDLRMEAVALFQAQNEVAVSWKGEVSRRNGTRVPVDGISVFQFDDRARIICLRVYWDPRELTRS